MSAAQPPRGPIVVGVDGSALSNGAIRWAAAEAERRQVALRLVHVFVHVPVVHRYTGLEPADPKELTAHVRDAALELVRSEHPGLEVTAEVRTGAAAAELLAAARDASMLVVGARGYSRLSGWFIGSVSQQMAMHSSVPVVVVRSGPARNPQARVVVGMDGSRVSVRALDFAIEHAAALDCPVRVVRAEYFEPAAGAPPGPWYSDLVEDIKELTAEVRSAVDAATQRYPQIELQVVTDHPVAAIIEASLDARLVVVASRGLGGFAGLLLGSVSQGVLSRAEASVAVVPGPADRSPAPGPDGGGPAA